METILEIEDWKITIEIQPLAKNSENSSSLTRSLMRVAVRKSEKQKGDNSQEGWRKTIVHRFPSNYPFRAKKEKKKKILLFGTNDRSSIIAFSRAKSNALPASFASRAPSKPWLAEKWRNELPERKGRDREEERREGRDGGAYVWLCARACERKRRKEWGEKVEKV